MKVKITSTANRFNGEILLTYNKDEQLVAMQNDTDMDTVAVDYFLRNLPIRYSNLEELLSKTATLEVKVISEIPTFLQFWEHYNYKIAKKDAIKAYEKLSEHERTEAYSNVVAYDKYLGRTKIAKMYPATYLTAERYATEWAKIN